jgi:uncharacterized membrane protein
MIGGATLAGFYLAYAKYSHFNGDTNDLAIFSYAFEQTVKGRFLPLYYSGGNLMGNHPNFILLLWLPVYFVWRSFYSLLFYQSIMLTLGAWPLYLLAKDVLRNEKAALMLAGVFLTFPPIASQHVNQVHDDQFGLPFLMWAFLFYHRRQLGKFMLMLVLTCLAKEPLALTTAGFGLYALFQRRRWPWIAWPVIFSVGYLLGAIWLMTKLFAEGGTGVKQYTQMQYLEGYGASPREVLHTILTKPQVVLQNSFSSEKMVYLFKLLLPVGLLLPFLSACIWVAAPNLVLNIVGTNPAFTVIPWHYGVVMGAVLVVATVYGIDRVCRWTRTRESHLPVVAAALNLVVCILCAGFWFRSTDYIPVPEQAQLERALREVPKNASIVTTTPTLAQFSDRRKVNSAYSILFGKFKDLSQLDQYDYVLLDGHWQTGEAFAQEALYEAVRANHGYQPVFLENNVLLLRRIE